VKRMNTDEGLGRAKAGANGIEDDSVGIQSPAAADKRDGQSRQSADVDQDVKSQKPDPKMEQDKPAQTENGGLRETVDKEMRKRLASIGYPRAKIERLMDDEFYGQPEGRSEHREVHGNGLDKAVEDDLRKKLLSRGFTTGQVAKILDDKEVQRFAEEAEVGHAAEIIRDWPLGRSAIWPKIHQDYLALDTLAYYEIPWQYDKV
jgi:hypothetical protein